MVHVISKRSSDIALATRRCWTHNGSDFVLIAEGKPPPRIELRESGCSSVACISA
jgi:hypothetical protein